MAAVETGEGKRLNETLVKRLTGGDTVTARFMHKDWFQFRPIFVPWIATNHKPIVRGSDHAIWKRLRFVPFDVIIPPDERDGDLDAKLRAEAPGVLRWILDGYEAYAADGLPNPEPVARATAAHRQQMDVIGDFLQERTITGASLRVKPTDLYRAFEEHVGRDVRIGSQAFYLEIQRRGFEARRNGRGRWYEGIGLLRGDPVSGWGGDG